MSYCFSVVLLLRITHGFRTLNLRQLFLILSQRWIRSQAKFAFFPKKDGSWANSLTCNLYDADRGAFPAAAAAQETHSGLHSPEILATKAKVDIFWPKAK